MPAATATKKAKAAELPSVASILAASSKKWNTPVGPMSEITDDVARFSCGNMAIDYVIGGGVPMGRIIEAFGFPSSGKSTWGLMVAAAMQKIIMAGGDPELGIGPDDAILYLDYEHAMDPEYAKALGLDVDHRSFLFSQPDTFEEGANIALEAIKTGRVRLTIVDALAAMVPSARAQAEIGKSLPAVTAKLTNDFASMLNPLLDRHNSTFIFLNHLKEKMEMGGARPGMPTPTSTPGGAAVKFYASIRLQFTKAGAVKGEVYDPVTGETEQGDIGNKVIVKAVKNKTAPPQRKATVRVTFGRGFEEFFTALQVLTAAKLIVSESGGMFYFHKLADDGLTPEWMDRSKTGTNRPYIRGQENLYDVADEHPEWRAAFIEKARSVYLSNVAKHATGELDAKKKPEADDE